MLIKNKELLQSYLLTTAKYDYSVYEKRVLYRLVEYCQYQLEGKKITKDIRIDKNLIDTYTIEVPLSEFASHGEVDNNNNRLKNALKSLQRKIFEFQDGKSWESISIIANPKFQRKKNVTYVKFLVDEKIYEAILNFSKGFRRIEIETAMNLESTYAMRFYELMGGKVDPIKYSMDSLREMFNLQDKYERINDFQKRVLDTAKRELDKSSPVSFDYKPYKQGRKIIGYEFFPKHIKENQDPSIEENKLNQKISPQWELERPVLDILRYSFGMKHSEVQRNMKLFKMSMVIIDDFAGFLKDIHTRSENKQVKNSIGYLINSLKDEINKI